MIIPVSLKTTGRIKKGNVVRSQYYADYFESESVHMSSKSITQWWLVMKKKEETPAKYAKQLTCKHLVAIDCGTWWWSMSINPKNESKIVVITYWNISTS